MLSKKNIPYTFIAVFAVFIIIDFVINTINHKFLMDDFKVYYGAAHAITSGGEVYGTLFSLGSGYYKYSPFIAFVFYPLSILPYYVACIIYFLLISAATLFTSILLFHIFSTYVFTKPNKSSNLILFLSLLCIALHLERELGLGNINMVLLLLLSLTLLFILEKRMIAAGVLLAFVIITKPFFIILFIPLVMRRYFKTGFITALLLLLSVILPATILGVGKDIELHKQWLSTMLLHADAFPSSNTIESLLHTYFSFAGNLQYIVLVSVLVLYVLFIGMNLRTDKKAEKTGAGSFIMEWFIIIALTPSLFKTDTEHFLVSLPIILFILIYLFQNKNTLLTVLFVILIILYGGNSSDLLGKHLSEQVNNMGMLGISNLLLIALALFIYSAHYRNRKELI